MSVLLTRRATVSILCDSPTHKKGQAQGVLVAEFAYVDGNGEGWVNATRGRKFRAETAEHTTLRCRVCGQRGVNVVLRPENLTDCLDRIRDAGASQISLHLLALGSQR